MKKTPIAAAFAALSLFAFAPAGLANSIEVDVYKARTENPYRVAISPFAGDGDGLGQILNENLNRTELTATNQNLPAQATSAADFTNQSALWRQAGYPYLVVGGIQKTADNQAAIRFEVIEVATGRVIQGTQTQRAGADAQSLRHAAHVVSDRVYELITGVKGDFSGRIAYIEELGSPTNKTSRLMVMDADGQNARVLRSVQGSLFSPAWSPDGRSLAYAEQLPNGLPIIYIQNVDSGARQLLTPFKGNNLGPSFSPDGASVIFSGSHENNDPAIYEIHIASGVLKKLTHMAGAENSPSFAPDGRSFVFTADNGSRTPRLHRYNLATGQVNRLGNGAAANPHISPDGKKIAFVAGNALVVLQDGRAQSIAPSNAHESASFSPNGSRIVFATPQGLTIRHLATGASFSKSGQGRLREPTWSGSR